MGSIDLLRKEWRTQERKGNELLALLLTATKKRG